MITVNDVSMNFSGQTLFKHVDLKFTPGNCYGIIGANGAGKSTFLRILSGDLEPTTGEVIIPKEERMSILKQDHFQYDAYTVLDTVIMGNQHLYDVMKEKDALYEKEDFTDEDGVKASELEAEFAEMGGWEAESDVSRLIQGLGLSNDILYSEMSSLTAKEKVKVLLAQALFGKPDIILLDEPTNHLDIQAIEWLEDFLMDCEALTIVVTDPLQARGSEIHPRQLLWYHRRQRRRQVHLPAHPLRRPGAYHRRGHHPQGRAHVHSEAGPLPVRRLHGAGYGHHGQPAPLRRDEGEGCPL